MTTKGLQTRHHILSVALNLFTTRGYEATTMRDIAEAADCSPGLTYRYFAHKEDLVMALYDHLAQQSLAYAGTLPPGVIAEGFHALMQHKLTQMQPYRAAVAAMFGALMRPEVGTSVWGQQSTSERDAMVEAFGLVMQRATDKLTEPLASSMTTLLYCFHLLLLLFWLYDRTPEQRATGHMLDFMREALKLVRPMMIMPLIGKATIKLAHILALVFGGMIPRGEDHPEADKTP
ncbi:MAG: TetR/AcrR family transcriptional regulator [Anaerolineae bacterium]|nr:TetR/AcrR family transcriptional regulator [Anaerolineae bacterium]